MEMIGKVRRMKLRDQLSNIEIAKRTGLSRNTVKKWLKERGDEAPQYRRAKAPTKLSTYEATLVLALKADALRPKQGRRSARANPGPGLHRRLSRWKLEATSRLTQGAIVASHERISDRGQVRYDWQHYVPLVQRKPGVLRNGAPFTDLPEPLQKLRTSLLREDGGDKVMAQVLAIVPKVGLQEVLVAVELALESAPASGRVSVEHVINVLARLSAAPTPENVATTLQAVACDGMKRVNARGHGFYAFA